MPEHLGADPTIGRSLRVLLVDDQALVRSGFAMILGVEDDLDVVGEAPDGEAALRLVAELTPDVVLMDVQMPRMDGIEATRRIVESGASTKVIILTTFDRDDYVFDGLRAGASGFLLKNADPDQLVEAIRTVGDGHALLAPEVTRRVIEQLAGEHAAPPPETAGHLAPARPRPPELARLTDREREVLTLVAGGLSNGEIAKHLFLGEATVKTHVSNVLAKLGLRDRVQAVVYAYEVGLVRPEG